MESARAADPIPAAALPAAGERCASCGEPLAPDQRYCVECGDRRGAPRLPFMDGRRRVVHEPPPSPRRPRVSSGATLVAGVGTLLIALAVGVLIGRSSRDTRSTPSSAPVRVVTIPAGGGAAAATPAPTTTPTATADGAKPAKKDKAAPTHAAPEKPAAAKTPPPVVKVGSKGNGRGYKHGRFTGDFFGP